MKRDMLIEEALRSIFSRLHSDIVKSVRIVLESDDVDAFHDLRVAIMRARTLFLLFKKNLKNSSRFSIRFKQYTDATNKQRDLDVFIAGLDSYVLNAEEDIVPLKEILAGERTREHDIVKKIITGNRFLSFLDAWECYFMMDSPCEASEGKREACSVFNEILRKHIKKLRRFRSKGVEANVHKIRIEFKKLRYLMEFSREFAGGEDTEKSIQKLKKIQDTLGVVQDKTSQKTILKQILSRISENESQGCENSAIAAIKAVYSAIKKELKKEKRHTVLLIENLLASNFLKRLTICGDSGNKTA